MHHFYKLLCISFIAASSNAAAAEIYTWKDKDGVTHFSEEKPKYEADINELELSPVSATVEDTAPVEETTPVQAKHPVAKKTEQDQQVSQEDDMSTEQDEEVFDGRTVDSTNVRIGKNINLNEELVDSLDKPRVEHHIVDRKDIRINNDLVDKKDAQRNNNVELKKRVVDSKRVTIRAAEK